MRHPLSFPRLAVAMLCIVLPAIPSFTAGAATEMDRPGIAPTEPMRAEAPSYLTRLWVLDVGSRDRGSAITPYRGNYILPLTYNSSPNESPFRESDPDRKLENLEVLFQISFKTKVLEDILDRKMDLWVAYTQRSFWQFYDFDDSSPFRETNYEPELLLAFCTNYRLLGLRGRYISVGVNHQSNGRSEPTTRSWNRAVANFGFERDSVVLVLNTWYRIPEAESGDDNPDIEKYLGYGQIHLYVFRAGHRFGLLLRNNLRLHENRGALRLERSFPLITWITDISSTSTATGRA